VRWTGTRHAGVAPGRGIAPGQVTHDGPALGEQPALFARRSGLVRTAAREAGDGCDKADDIQPCLPAPVWLLPTEVHLAAKFGNLGAEVRDPLEVPNLRMQNLVAGLAERKGLLVAGARRKNTAFRPGLATSRRLLIQEDSGHRCNADEEVVDLFPSELV
jgi:hypothetical protein